MRRKVQVANELMKQRDVTEVETFEVYKIARSFYEEPYVRCSKYQTINTDIELEILKIVAY